MVVVVLEVAVEEAVAVVAPGKPFHFSLFNLCYNDNEIRGIVL